MADGLPYFKFYPADFMGSGKVQIMSPAERGIYISLLCHAWQEGPLPDDPSKLARVSGASPSEMEDAWPAVRRCFQVDDQGRLYHPRLEKERAEAMNRTAMARKAAAARWKDADADASGDADADASGDADADADAMRSGMPLERCADDAILRDSETQSTENTDSPETQSSEERRGLSRLLDYLPEGEAVENCVGAVARSAKGSLDSWALGFVGMYGPGGTRAGELGAVPEDDRPTVLLDALQAYLAEGQPWDQRFFSGFLRGAVKRHLGGEGPDFGDEGARDAERRASYRQRETERQREEWEEQDAEADAEMAALWSWWEDADAATRQVIEAEAQEKCETVPKQMHRAILVGVIQEHRQQASEGVG